MYEQALYLIETHQAEGDDACYEALEPAVSALARAADDQGHPFEVSTTIAAIAIDSIYMTNGRRLAVETLAQLRERD